MSKLKGIEGKEWTSTREKRKPQQGLDCGQMGNYKDWMWSKKAKEEAKGRRDWIIGSRW